MTVPAVTRHAMQRMAQRAFRLEDFDLIMMIGTKVEGGYIVLTMDCQAAERGLKRLLNRVRRLNGKRLVVEGREVVTAYRVDRQTDPRLVRGAGDRKLAA